MIEEGLYFIINCRNGNMHEYDIVMYYENPSYIFECYNEGKVI